MADTPPRPEGPVAVGDNFILADQADGPVGEEFRETDRHDFLIFGIKLSGLATLCLLAAHGSRFFAALGWRPPCLGPTTICHPFDQTELDDQLLNVLMDSIFFVYLAAFCIVIALFNDFASCWPRAFEFIALKYGSTPLLLLSWANVSMFYLLVVALFDSVAQLHALCVHGFYAEYATVGNEPMPAYLEQAIYSEGGEQFHRVPINVRNVFYGVRSLYGYSLIYVLLGCFLIMNFNVYITTQKRDWTRNTRDFVNPNEQ